MIAVQHLSQAAQRGQSLPESTHAADPLFQFLQRFVDRWIEWV